MVYLTMWEFEKVEKYFYDWRYCNRVLWSQLSRLFLAYSGTVRAAVGVWISLSQALSKTLLPCSVPRTDSATSTLQSLAIWKGFHVGRNTRPRSWLSKSPWTLSICATVEVTSAQHSPLHCKHRQGVLQRIRTSSSSSSTEPLLLTEILHNDPLNKSSSINQNFFFHRTATSNRDSTQWPS